MATETETSCLIFSKCLLEQKSHTPKCKNKPDLKPGVCRRTGCGGVTFAMGVANSIACQ